MPQVAYIVPGGGLTAHAGPVYRGEQTHPLEVRDVALADVRADLDRPAAEQIARRGWAVRRHASAHVARVGDADGIEAYLEESRALLQRELGCTRVHTWNSTCRKADRREPVPVTRQLAPEAGFLPTTRVQPPASFAHVDQEAAWARVVVARATGADASTFRRSMIVNLWRPIKVTNSPLAMLDYRSLKPGDTHPVSDDYGVGLHLSYSPAHRWSYLRHQRPDEVVLLKCYDSEQGAGGEALFAGHVAADIDDADGVNPADVFPRESVEVRMIAVWD